MERLARITFDGLVATAAKFPDHIRERQTAIDFCLGLCVLKYYLGQDWLETHTNPYDPRPGFFRLDIGESASIPAMSGFKLLDLAELFFNLQHIPGFDSCIRRMRDGDLEPTLAELDIGRMLYVNDWNFRFVEPQGAKRSDYDLEITLDDGTLVCADAKCKISTTPLSENTVMSALKKALKQLPEEHPGIVFIKFPPDWMEIAGFEKVLGNTALSFFRSTERIVSVAFYSAPMKFTGEYLSQGHQFMDVPNKNNRFDRTRNWRLFLKWKPDPGSLNAMPPKWQRLINFPHGPK